MELNVGNNGIDEFGCFTLMVGLRENKSLRNLVLDGNPLGVQVRMLFRLYVCTRLTVYRSFNSFCMGILVDSPQCLFE